MVLQSVEIQFNCEMFPTTSQKHFLSNYQNKARFIDGLKTCMVENSICVVQDRDDADNLIVQTAIQASNDNGMCTIIGTDTDILALLIHKCTNQGINYHIPGTELILMLRTISKTLKTT